jgi:formylglycine-generating enzyme required for sulfatase activity
MNRRVCLALIAILAINIPLHAQDKKDPSKNYTNSLGMKFVWIPPGTFLMGSPKEEKGRDANETQHKVTLTKGFYMGVYTVTQEEWQAVMGNNPSGLKGEENLPVEQVSWNDCDKFIKKVREKDKRLYRLPTEAEWEYACRAGTKTAYYFGDDKSMLGKFAWYSENNPERKTHPVGQKKPNEWGLYDMHGNLFQWCQDWYGEYPQNDLADPQGPEKGTSRVMRGGAWGNDPAACRSAFRLAYEPGRGNFIIGFRLCFSLE